MSPAPTPHSRDAAELGSSSCSDPTWPLGSPGPPEAAALEEKRTAVERLVRCVDALVNALFQAGFSEEEAERAVRFLIWSSIGSASVESGIAPLDPTARRGTGDRVEPSPSHLRGGR